MIRWGPPAVAWGLLAGTVRMRPRLVTLRKAPATVPRAPATTLAPTAVVAQRREPS